MSDSVSPVACALHGLTKNFGSIRAVDGLTLSLPSGTLYALLGANGAGKTTSLRMMAGLIEPDAGEIKIHGVSMHQAPSEAKRHLAYLPDEPLLYGKLRPLEHLEFVASLWNVPSVPAQIRAEALLKELGFWEKRSSWIESLSRGMKQKLALASAFLHSPSLILLDEPLTGLDASSARQVKDLLVQFTRDGGTVLLTTHILDVAERLADRIGILQSGRITHDGSLAELREHAKTAQGTLEDVFLQLTTPSTEK
ncbi:ABC transporter ATP-binding protein [Opitutaceae bacterium]